MAVKVGENGDRENGGADDSMNRKLVHRYREASAEADERPAASARASILAAAAREVGARPVDAATYRRTRARWPLAAAATVMLSTLAVMLAIRTNEEMPQFAAPTEPARTSANSVAPSAPAPAVAEQQQSREAGQQASGMAEQEEKRAIIKPQAPENRQAKTPSERPAASARSEVDAVTQAPRENGRAAMADESAADSNKAKAEAQRPMAESEQARLNAAPPLAAPAATSPSAEPAARSKLSKDKQAEGAAARAEPTDQARAEARRDLARDAAPAPQGALQSERKQLDESAATWIERIIKLRRDGRHDEADAELKRFRERYPQVQPPPEALNPAQQPAGTR